MNVVYYSSDYFSEMCGVAITSLCENNREEDEITIYVVESKISEENKQRLKNITDRYSRKLVFIPRPTQEEVYPGISTNLGNTYARMALGELLPPEVDRVLSLDSDTLVLDSLGKMYRTEFAEDEFVAGVYDCVGKAIQSDVLHCPEDLKYCNAGMYLIDLKKWRARNIGKQLLDLVLENADGKHIMYFLEQDLMNLAFYGHLKLLHPRYNMLTSIYYFNYDEVIRMKRPVRYYSRKVVEEGKTRPALVHATTCFYFRKRMWVSGSDHPYYRKYLQYRQMTEWKNDPEKSDDRNWKKRLYGGFWHLMPRCMAVSLAAFLINFVRPTYARITTRLKMSTIATQS